MPEPKRQNRSRSRLGAKRASRFDSLVAIYDRFNVELLRHDHPLARSMAENWTSAKTQYLGWLADPESDATRSKLASGMMQALREMPRFLREMPREVSASLLPALRRITSDELPNFFDYEFHKLARIVVRGRIRNADEYYLARHRLDEIEGSPEHREEEKALLSVRGIMNYAD